MIGLGEELAAREAQSNPVKIGLIGAGQMGTDIVAQVRMMKGIDVVVAADADLKRARNAYRIGMLSGEVVEAKSSEEADKAVAKRKRAITSDYRVVTDMRGIDVVLEATGVPEVGARAAIRSARGGHPVAMMNVETDITVGPILNWYAKKKGTLYALAAGDEPAACKELYDFAVALGFTVVAAGKGKNNPLDRYAMPTDEVWSKEAARRGVSPNMLIEFVDGSKTMIEMAAVSNATGLVPDVRGMHGPATNWDELHRTFALKRHGGVLDRMGVVDYGVGKVAPGVFVIVTTEHPRLREALVLRDMGHGPYYTLLRPYHLCSIEVPLTCAMLVIWRKSNMAPRERLVSEVFAVAKRDLQRGEILDGIGGCTFYSVIDSYEAAKKERLLPIGVAKGARVVRPVKKDTPISLNDVELHEPSTVLSLRCLQDAWMAGEVDEGKLIGMTDGLAAD